MANVNYKELEEAIHWAKEYTHGSSHATSEYIDDVLNYNVYSYNTLMLTIKGGEVTYYNDEVYSQTTSRLQNIIKRNWYVGEVIA